MVNPKPAIFIIIFAVGFFLIWYFFFLAPQAAPQAQPELSTTITPARDLTGQWAGSVSFTERVPQCNYQGSMQLNLQQQGNNLQGGFQVTVTSARGNSCVRIGSVFNYLVTGTVSASAIDLTVAGTDKLVGSFTTDLMTLRESKCTDCSSGPAIIFVGPMQLRRT